MKIKKYSNNLRLVVNTKKDIDVVSFVVFVGAGSKDEKEGEQGYAHFLEHMFFKSTENYLYADILKNLDELGVLNNAYTSMGKTCFYFKCLTSVLDETLKIFSNMFFNKKFQKKEVDSERKVILEELKMDEDDQTKKAISLAFKAMFDGTNYGHDVIGTTSSIKSVTAEKLSKFKAKYYLPHNVVISVSGNASFSKIDKLVQKYFISNMQKEPQGEPKYEQAIVTTIANKYIAKKKDNKQSIIYILTNLGERSVHEKAVLNLYYAILGYGMSSRLFETLRGKMGLVYSIDAGCSIMAGNVLSEILFATTTENVKDALIEIKNILKDCADGNVLEAELVRAKNRYIASIEYSNESNSTISEINGNDLLTKGYIRSDREVIKELSSVTLDEIKDVAKQVYNNKNFVVSSVGNCTKTMLKEFK